MSEDYKEILSNSDKITTDYEEQPKRLHYLRGVITDLYINYVDLPICFLDIMIEQHLRVYPTSTRK